MIRVFIGYDSNEEIAFNVLSASIQKHASKPVSITPIRLSQLTEVFSRDRNELQSTQFSFSRFLTPFLSGYKGWSIFMDCDMLFVDDIVKLWNMKDDRYAIQVVKHNHQPTEDIKFLGAKQTKYEKKNWSSVIMFNNAKCQALSSDYVNNASGLELHQFKWLNDDSLIGSLPKRWNYLAGYDPYVTDVANIHYTLGGPYFKEYQNCDFDTEWKEAFKEMLYASQKSDLLSDIEKHIK